MVECDEGGNAWNRIRFEDANWREGRDTISSSILGFLSMHPWVQVL